MTSSAADPLTVLARSVDQAAGVIAAVGAGQWEMRTPCHDWHVTKLVDHVIQSTRNGAVRAAGGQPDWKAAAPHAEDPAAEFRSAGGALVTAWRDVDMDAPPAEGEWPRRLVVEQLTSELAVHTWDVARATGQSTALDPEVGEVALTFGRDNLKANIRGEAFGPEVSIDASAPLYDRLAAFFGRDPSRV